MSKIKVMVLALLTAGSSAAALASNCPKNCSSCVTPVTIPCVKNQWHAGVSALYLRPNFGGNNLGYSSFSNYGTDFFNHQVEINGASNYLNKVAPNRAWGFQLEAGYEFCDGYDLDIRWFHWDNVTHGNLPEGTLFAGSASALYAGKLDVKPEWNAVDLELGQRFDLNPMNILHLNAGLEFAKIQTTFTNYPMLNPTGSPIFITHDTLTYTGFGPYISGDYTFNTCVGLDFYAKASSGLLVGTAKQSVSGYRDLGGFNLYSTGNYNQSNSNVIVPKFSANFGLKYDLKLCQGNLNFDLGYMFVSYLGALVSQVGAGVVSSSISTSSSTNFNLNGPYLGVTYSGLIC